MADDAAVQPFPHRVEHLSIGERDPFPSEAGQVAAKPAMAASTPRFEGGRRIDPVMAGFDHFVALGGYVLLFLSVFMFGVPALASAALAFAHRRNADGLAQSHYRFQLRIFGTAILLLVLALGSAVAASGLAMVKVALLLQLYFPTAASALAPAQPQAWGGTAAACLFVAAAVLAVLAVIWTLAASFTGFLRLLACRPIGHSIHS